MDDQGIIIGTKVVNCIYCGNTQMIPENTDFRFETINCSDCKKIISKEIHQIVELPEFDMKVNIMFLGDPDIPELNEERIKSLVDLTDHNLKEWDENIIMDTPLREIRSIKVFTLHLKILTNAKRHPFIFRLEAVGIMAATSPVHSNDISEENDCKYYEFEQLDHDNMCHMCSHPDSTEDCPFRFDPDPLQCDLRKKEFEEKQSKPPIRKILGIRLRDDLAQVDYAGQSHFFRLQQQKEKKRMKQ